jgi:hypothetical protein
MQFTRIHADPGGHTHFEAVEVAFTSVDFAPPPPAIARLQLRGGRQLCDR